MSLLENDAILITPGTFGVGAVAARVFAEEGARLVVAGTRTENAERLVPRLEELGTEARYVPLDLTGSEEAIQEAISDAAGAFDGLDGVFCCPARWASEPLLEELDPADFDRTIARNVRGPFLVCKHAAEVLASGGGGTITLLGSVYARVTGSVSASFEVAQGMIEAITRGLGLHYAERGVTVNSVQPGHHVLPEDDLEDEFPVWRLTSEADREHLVQFYPAGRLAEAAEVARTAAFLLSGRAGPATGTSWLLDGGLTTR